MGTVAEYLNEFEILINQLPGIHKSLRKSFYISRLKPALQCALRELLRSYPLTLGEAFFKARIIESRFEDENNQAVDTNVGDQEDPDNVEDQQVSEADDDTNNDDFSCSLPPHKGGDLTVEEVVLENIKSDLKKDEDEKVRYSKADGTWVPAMRIEDG
ncbi:hypothetical protein Tco_1281509 [Tanacetum coccineum]